MSSECTRETLGQKCIFILFFFECQRENTPRIVFWGGVKSITSPHAVGLVVSTQAKRMDPQHIDLTEWHLVWGCDAAVTPAQTSVYRQPQPLEDPDVRFGFDGGPQGRGAGPGVCWHDGGPKVTAGDWATSTMGASTRRSCQ